MQKKLKPKYKKLNGKYLGFLLLYLFLKYIENWGTLESTELTCIIPNFN